MGTAIKNYKDLTVWQKAMVTVEEVYEIASALPKDEKYALASQIRRAAISVPANIAEGFSRGTRKDYAQFVSISYGSAAELETLLLLSARLKLVSANKIRKPMETFTEILRMLNKLRQSLKDNPKT